MRGLTEKNGGSSRSISTCSFCRSPNHQVGKCPHVPIIKKSLDKGIIPLKYMATITPNDTSGQNSSWRQNSSYWRSPLASYYTNGEHWGDLYKQTYRAFAKWERAQAKAKNKKKGKRSVKRTCGYCGGDHTRRTCGLLASHKTKLAKANRNFRKWFYQKYVVEQGLSTGAIVDIDVQIQGGYNRPAQDKTIRTLVTEINWDTINLFATKEKADTGWNRINQYTGDGGQEKLNNIENFIHSGAYLKVPKKVLEDNGVQTYHYYYEGNNGTYSAVPLSLKPTHRPIICPWETKREPYSGTAVRDVTIVSRAPQVLADDWVDGYADEMAVIFKKFSLAQLDFLGVIDHIKEWEKKEI